MISTLHEDKNYGSDTCVLQGSLANEHDLAIIFCLTVSTTPVKALSSDGCCSLAILFSVQEHSSPSLALNRSTKILLKTKLHVKLDFIIIGWKIMSTSLINIPLLFSLNCFCYC